MADVREFGRIGEAAVHEIVLRSEAGATASILTIGAAIRALEVPLRDGTRRSVVLGLETAPEYADNPGHLGVMVGRVANRIGGGRFRLDGREVVLPINDGGRNTLHGGPIGFTRRIWRIVGATATTVDLALTSPDGEEGWPGRVEARLRYALEGTALAITAEATSDAPTPVNLANHAYLTLSGGDDCRDHLLRIAAEFHTPVDDAMIPTGAVAPVAGTRFDFRAARPIGGDYDINFVLAGAPGEIARAAEVTAPDGRLRLEVETDQPGLQLYTAQWLGEAVVGGRRVGARGGFCLEAQGLVDAPNKRHFPSVTLRPGATYRHATIYRFVALGD